MTVPVLDEMEYAALPPRRFREPITEALESPVDGQLSGTLEN